MLLISTSLFLIIFITICSGYPGYKNKIPHGDDVPNPCPSGGNWIGVGHKSINGGGPLNPFGQAFHDASLNWISICQLDSDGDGISNGVELGDPDCKWKSGQTPSNNATGHPGICEPMNDAKCKGKNTDVC